MKNVDLQQVEEKPLSSALVKERKLVSFPTLRTSLTPRLHNTILAVQYGKLVNYLTGKNSNNDQDSHADKSDHNGRQHDAVGDMRRHDRRRLRSNDATVSFFDNDAVVAWYGRELLHDHLPKQQHTYVKRHYAIMNMYTCTYVSTAN